MNVIQDIFRGSLLILAISLGTLAAGCNDKETLLDVETPNGGVEIEQDNDTGQVNVQVDSEE